VRVAPSLQFNSGGLGVILSVWFLSPLWGSTVFVPVSPGSLSLTRGYYLPPPPGRIDCVRWCPEGAAENSRARAERAPG